MFFCPIFLTEEQKNKKRRITTPSKLCLSVFLSEKFIFDKRTKGQNFTCLSISNPSITLTYNP